MIFIADGKRSVKSGSPAILLIVVLYRVCDGLELLCVQDLDHCWVFVSAG